MFTEDTSVIYKESFLEPYDWSARRQRRLTNRRQMIWMILCAYRRNEVEGEKKVDDAQSTRFDAHDHRCNTSPTMA